MADIDLHALDLLRLVAKYRGFTPAAKAAGLSQSALTRQVQNIEARLGFAIFERSTRQVHITEPGAILLRETESIPHILNGALRRIREDYQNTPRQIRIGISPSLALAHIPGILHHSKRLHPEITTLVSQDKTPTLLKQLDQSQLDLALLTQPNLIPKTLRITHQMADQFCLISSTDNPPPINSSLPSLRKWAQSQHWLLPPQRTATRLLLDQWSTQHQLHLTPTMEIENFDLIVQLTALNHGVALVPRRALSTFPRKNLLQKTSLNKSLTPPTRNLVVLAQKHAKLPDHLQQFIHNILFS